MSVDLKLSVRRDMRFDAPEYEVRHPLERPAAARAGYHATTGIESDLMEAAKQATRAMISHIVEREGISREQAYALCSVAGELTISEVVDIPNWAVSAFVPNDIFLRSA